MLATPTTFYCHSLGDIAVTEITTKLEMDSCISQLILACISAGGPATTVTWTRDSITVTQGNETVLNNSVTAQYTHTLTVAGTLGGYYTCTVSNNKPSSNSSSITVSGKHSSKYNVGMAKVHIVGSFGYYNDSSSTTTY